MRKRKKSWALDLFLAVAIGCCVFGLLAAPQESAAAAQDGLKLCVDVILPSLFPFFVLSALVVELGLAESLGNALQRVMRPLFGVPGACGAAVALGFIGGYPVGAKTAIALYEKGAITRTEAERLLSFCNNSGPAFILGAVGAGVFASGKLGWVLYLTHAAASLTVGLLFRFYGRKQELSDPMPPTTHPRKSVRLTRAFVASVGTSFQSVLGICGFVVFFTVAIRMLSVCGLLPLLARTLGSLTPGLGEDAANRLLTGLIEVTSGLWSLRGAEAQLPERLAMAAFMLGWAGVSVHCQVLSFIGESGLSSRTYVLGKLAHAALSALYAWAVLDFLRIEEPVSDLLAEQVTELARMDFGGTLTASLLVTLSLCAALGIGGLINALWQKPKHMVDMRIK